MRNYIASFIFIVFASIVSGCGSGIPTSEISTLELIQREIEKQGLSWLTVESLFLHDEGITDLQGIEECENLRHLTLWGNDLKGSSLAPIAGLSKLKSLDVSGNNLTSESLQCLESLKDLEFLHVAENNITDISALSELPKLQYLDLSYNKITDLSPLSELRELQALYLEGNDLGTIQPLAELDLRLLILSDNNLNDITPLIAMLPLKEVVSKSKEGKEYVLTSGVVIRNIGLTEAEILFQLELTPEEATQLKVEY